MAERGIVGKKNKNHTQVQILSPPIQWEGEANAVTIKLPHLPQRMALINLPSVAVSLQLGPSNPLSHVHLSLAVQTPETHGELHVPRYEDSKIESFTRSDIRQIPQSDLQPNLYPSFSCRFSCSYRRPLERTFHLPQVHPDKARLHNTRQNGTCYLLGKQLRKFFLCSIF